METKDLGKTSTGMQANVAAMVSYILGWLTGLVFVLTEKDNKFVRFHAMQSIIVFGAFTALSIALSIVFQMFAMLGLNFVFLVLTLASSLISLASLVLWIILMVKAYQGEYFKLPVAGDLAERMLKSSDTSQNVSS